MSGTEMRQVLGWKAMEHEREPWYRRWLRAQPLIRTPAGLFAPRPPLPLMLGAGLLLVAVIAFVLIRTGDPFRLVGVAPPALLYLWQLAEYIRYRDLEGRPIATLDGDLLELSIPNYFGRTLRIDLKDAAALSFYGRARAEFAVIRHGDRVERHYPAWNERTRVQIQQFLEDTLAGRVEVRLGEVPDWFDEVRGRYEP
jgi:hypothetical protein